MVHVRMGKQIVGIPLAVAILLIGWFMPSVEGLGHEGIVGLAILFAAVALWICETLPMDAPMLSRGSFQAASSAAMSRRSAP